MYCKCRQNIKLRFTIIPDHSIVSVGKGKGLKMWRILKVILGRSPSRQQLQMIYRAVEGLLGILMKHRYPFGFDSNIICNNELDSDCVCPYCMSLAGDLYE